MNNKNNSNSKKIPCCTVLGHVDVGKTKLLDHMRQTDTEEAAGITQQIGTTLYTRERLLELVGDKLSAKLNLDYMLMIDTPGHECFDMIRYVALKVSDVVILMIDAIKGLEKQTKAVIKMLEKFNKPYIICVNKIDRIYGWKKPDKKDDLHLKAVLKRMSNETQNLYETYIQKIQYKLYEFEINSELYYQNRDPKTFSNIVPISAETGEGIPDLIMLIGLMAEKQYFADVLIDSNLCHGYVLDSHYDRHYGKYHVIVHRHGKLMKGDTLKIKDTDYKIKSILVNNNNTELKDEHRFLRVESIDGSLGCGLVLQSANNPEIDTINLEAGSLYFTNESLLNFQTKNKHNSDFEILNNVEQAIKSRDTKDVQEYEEQWKNHLCPPEVPGIQVISPSHIMMDGLLNMLAHHFDDKRKKESDQNQNAENCFELRIERYKIGRIDKKDMFISNKWIDMAKTKEDKLNARKYAVILSYDPSKKNVSKEILKLAEQFYVKVIHSPVVYELIEAYEKYVEDVDKLISDQLNEPTGTITVISKFVFRTSNPVVCGVKVNNGKISKGDTVYTDPGMNKLFGRIESIQKDNNDIEDANCDDEVCLKIKGKITLPSNEETFYVHKK